jgi:hypothetical protein
MDPKEYSKYSLLYGEMNAQLLDSKIREAADQWNTRKKPLPFLLAKNCPGCHEVFLLEQMKAVSLAGYSGRPLYACDDCIGKCDAADLIRKANWE